MASGGEALEPLDRYKSKRLARRRHFMRRMVTRPVISTVVRPTVMGEENVEGLEGPFLVIPNHQSHLDAPMVFSLLPDKLTEHLATGAAADYFYRKRFISSLTSLFFNTYPVERKGKARARRASKAAGMTRRLLEAGVPILVFRKVRVRVTASSAHSSLVRPRFPFIRVLQSCLWQWRADMKRCPWDHFSRM